MKFFYQLSLLITIKIISYSVGYCQVPTVQDCMGAIPVCQTTYWQSNSFSGTGNYPNEINASGGTCLLAGEKNDVWYIFTVISSGQLSFMIQPNNNADDYDWALFNLTNANCADIFTNNSLEVCCNYSASDGATGMANPANASCDASALDNTISPTIGVTAGQTYVLNISNFSSTNYGYNLNFGASTASIFDNIPPVFQSVNTAGIFCGTNQITFTFSENVLCNTVSPCDFTLTGPGGPYTITAITGAGCSVGAPMENTFTVTVSPPITAPGNYTISLVNACSSVADNCNNLANPASFNFVNTAPGVTVNPANSIICAGGCASITASGANTYNWSHSLGTSALVNPCPTTTTTYTVTGTSTGCTSTATATVTVNPNPSLSLSATPAAICSGQNSTLSASGANSYTWQPGGQSGNSIIVNPTTTTVYTVTGTTGSCSSTATVTLTVNPNPTVNASASPATVCMGQVSNLTANGANTYLWMPGNLTGSSINVTPNTTTTYTVTGTSVSGCTSTATVTVSVNPNASISASATNPIICMGGCTDLTAGGGATYTWNPGGLSGSTVNVCPGTTTTYTVTGTTANGCTGSNTVNVTVVANPVTTVAATLNPICVGQNTTLQGSGASNYFWQPGSLNGSSVVVSPTTTTTYTVTGSSGNCSSTATISITVNPVPALSVTPSSPAICAGQQVGLTLNSNIVLSGCTWNPTTGLTPSSSCNPTANPVVTTTYNVTGQTAAGCTSSAGVTVTVNPNPTVNISSNAPGNAICAGQCAQLSAIGIPAVTSWNWLPATGLSSANVSNPNACPVTTTTYTATAQSAAGCSGSNSITITVNPVPVLNVTPQPATICNGGNIQLSVSGNPALSSCNWLPNNTLNPSAGSCTPLASPTSTTTYTVTGTTSAGCTSSASATVNVNPNPIITINPASVSVCIGNSTTITANDNPVGIVNSWSWLPATGINPSNSNNPTVNPISTTTYTVTGTTSPGCTGSASITVTVNQLPVINFGQLPTLCVSSPVLILNQALPGGGTYFGTGVNNNTFDPAVAGVGTHTIYYAYSNPSTGCSDTASQSITINAGIPVSTNPSAVSVCPGGNAIITASGASNYIWTPSSGLNVTTGPVVTAQPSSPTTYTVIGSNADGCSGSSSVSVSFYSTSQVGIVAVPNEGCNPLDVTFNFAPASYVANGTWSWNFGDIYSSNNTSNDSTAQHLYAHEGNFIATFNGMDINGCVISATTNIDVFIKPHADFYFNPEVGYTSNPEITFTDFSIGANSWLWNFGDPASINFNFSDLKNPTHIFSDSGTFTVMLIVWSSHTCSDTATHDVTIFPEPIVYIPNSFSPNSDILNDVFRPVINGIDKKTFKMYIFDRWGKKIYFTDDLYKGWDGKNNGKPVEIGVFTYIIYFNEYTGKEHKIIGKVTLIR